MTVDCAVEVAVWVELMDSVEVMIWVELAAVVILMLELVACPPPSVKYPTARAATRITGSRTIATRLRLIP